jgi:ankyrin repeat protein
MEHIHYRYLHHRNDLLTDIEENRVSYDECNTRLLDGTTLLHEAVRRRDVEMIKALFSRRVNMPVADVWSVQPISIAATRGYTEIVQLFLENGYKINYSVTEKSYSPVWCAIRNKHTDIVKLFFIWFPPNISNSEVLLEIAHTGNIELFDIAYGYIPIPNAPVPVKPITRQIVAGQGITITANPEVNYNSGTIPNRDIGIRQEMTIQGDVVIRDYNTPNVLYSSSITLLDIVDRLAASEHISLIKHILERYDIPFRMGTITMAMRGCASVDFYKAILKRHHAEYRAQTYITVESLLSSMMHENSLFDDHQNYREVFELFCVIGLNRSSCFRSAHNYVLSQDCLGCYEYFVKILILSGYNQALHSKIAKEITLFDRCYYIFRRSELLLELGIIAYFKKSK